MGLGRIPAASGRNDEDAHLKSVYPRLPLQMDSRKSGRSYCWFSCKGTNVVYRILGYLLPMERLVGSDLEVDVYTKLATCPVISPRRLVESVTTKIAFHADVLQSRPIVASHARNVQLSPDHLYLYLLSQQLMSV